MAETMSLFDDDRPAKKTAHEIGSDLSLLSVDELTQRIALLQEEMENAVQLSVPLTADAAVGRTWYDAKG